jgi:uncharacterized membrane protein
MLAVAIFSLTTMVTAIQAASDAATPRIRGLLVGDRTAQITISIFVGTFLFSLLGIIGLSTGLFDDAGRFLLFGFTIAIIAAVVVALIRWIQKLSQIGGVNEVIDRAENATRGALTEEWVGYFGGRPYTTPPRVAKPVSAPRFGYVQYVDGAVLAKLSQKLDGRIFIAARPGTYVDSTRPLALVEGKPDEDACAKVRSAFVVGRERVFESDPSFGMIVLSEIALRALSPAVNDPGTAIEVIGAQTRLLDRWAMLLAETAKKEDIDYPKLFVHDKKPEALFADAFSAIARDGAGVLEVQMFLQKSLATLSATQPELFAAGAQRMSLEALERARAAMGYSGDIERLEFVAQRVGKETDADPTTCRER